MLAAIFRAERFQTYVYGRSFTIESDHNPLESISQKNLADMTAHLQHMLLCLQGYDYTICYCPGKEIALPNTLSWFSPCPGPDIPLDIALHHACLSPERKEAFQQAFVSDPEMHALANMIITGWPGHIKAVPCPLCPYWQHWETSPLKMASSYVEKPSLSLCLKGRGYYSNSTSSTKEPLKHSCLLVDVSSAQASTRP